MSRHPPPSLAVCTGLVAVWLFSTAGSALSQEMSSDPWRRTPGGTPDRVETAGQPPLTLSINPAELTEPVASGWLPPSPDALSALPVPPEPPVPSLRSSPAVSHNQDDWMEVLERLRRAEERLEQLEEERRNWLEPLYSDEGSALEAEDVEDLSPDFLKALRHALDDSPRLSPSVNVTGQVQVDFVTFNQSEANRETIGDLKNATGFRRARLGAFGELFETTEYRVEFDFASVGRPRFLDNWIAVKNVPYVHNVIVGHFFEPFSLERYTPNRFITFLERSSVDVFAPARNTGMMVFDHSPDQRLIWAFGVFRSESNEWGDSVNDSSDFAGTGHVTWLPVYDERDERYLVHLGASASYRAIGDKQVRFRKRPENELQAFSDFGKPFFADTGIIASDSFHLYGVEMASVWGPFSVQAEAVYTAVNRLDGPDPEFYAWYVYGSWFLTGESRSYSRTSILGRFREGIFQRMTPFTNAFKGNVDEGAPRGIGAWELAVRYSEIDLNSQDIEGNKVGTVTLGVNWYLNPHTRVQWNYLRPLVHSREHGRSTADIFGMRFGFEF